MKWDWATIPFVLCALLACPTICWFDVQVSPSDVEVPHEGQDPLPCEDHSCFCDGSVALTGHAPTPSIALAPLAAVAPATLAGSEPDPLAAGMLPTAIHARPPLSGGMLPLLI